MKNQAEGVAWEDVALSVLEQLGRPVAPVDSFEMARALGLRVELAHFPTARLLGSVVEVSVHASPRRQRWLVAHELGHWALRHCRCPDSEAAADSVAEALVLPKYLVDGSDWRVDELQATHSLCSRETIARRMLALRPARLGIWRGSRLLRYRVRTGPCPSHVSRFEAFLAGAALDSPRPLHGAEFIAFVDDELPKRVITLCSERLASVAWDQASRALSVPARRAPTRG